jgi:hypothetical protein
MTRIKLAAAIALASGLLVAAQGGAEARILCDGNYQIVNGYPVSTPYCRDWELAQVARSYGIRVSFNEMRYSDSKKGEVCRTIGHDIRVQEVCSPYRWDGGTFRRR